MLRAVVRNEPMNGKLVRRFKELGEDLGSKVSQQINLGIVAGDSRTTRFVESGTKMNRHMDGVIGASRRNVEAVVRTQMTHVSNRSARCSTRGIWTLSRGVQYVATLDSRTTDATRCSTRKVFKPTEGPRPCSISGADRQRSRSQSRGRTLERVQVGASRKGSESKVSKFRESMNGSVSGKTTYARWLKQQLVEVAEHGSRQEAPNCSERVGFT